MTECSLGLQQTAGFIHKVRIGSPRSSSHSPSPPPTLKMFCTCSSLKSVPEVGQHESSQFALLSLYTIFLSNFVFCGVWLSMHLILALTQTQSPPEDMVSMGSPFKRWLSSMWWVLQSPEMGWCPPCFPDHCPFIFCKMNKWDQADDPPASLKHMQIITNAPHYPESPPALFWAIQSLHTHDSVSPQWYTDRCPQGLAHPGKGSSNICPAVPQFPHLQWRLSSSTSAFHPHDHLLVLTTTSSTLPTESLIKTFSGPVSHFLQLTYSGTSTRTWLPLPWDLRFICSTPLLTSIPPCSPRVDFLVCYSGNSLHTSSGL